MNISVISVMIVILGISAFFSVLKICSWNASGLIFSVPPPHRSFSS
uniref:Uncharacterized protein n=1 Tax=Anguilla anguilla TaxID=7936 RepID=A0A0E9RKN9_ANGAN